MHKWDKLRAGDNGGQFNQGLSIKQRTQAMDVSEVCVHGLSSVAAAGLAFGSLALTMVYAMKKTSSRL